MSQEIRTIEIRSFSPTTAGIRSQTVDGKEVDAWFNTTNDLKEEMGKKLEELKLNKGDTIEITGSGGFYHEIKVIKRAEKKDYKNYKDYGKIGPKDLLNAKMAAQRNSISILDIMQRLGQLDKDNDLAKLVNMKAKDLYTELTGGEWK